MTKMSEVFGFNNDGYVTPNCMRGLYDDELEAAALAINSYDQHVSRIKELEAALNDIISNNPCEDTLRGVEINVSQKYIDRAIALLNQSNSVKGE